jgi:hypothetical protein
MPTRLSFLRRPLGSLAALAGIASLATLVACGDDAAPGSRISTLRVIAVRADKPYAKPGDVVKLDALWWDGLDPDHTKRARTWAWATCVNPTGTGIADCLTKIVQDAATTGKPPQFAFGSDLDTFQLTVPDDALSSLPPQARTYAEVGVVLIVCPGTLQLPDAQTKLSPGAFPVQCLDADGRSLRLDEFEAGLKRVFVRATTPNSNPTIASVSWDGATWAPGDVKTASACATDGNRYDRCDGSLTHRIAANVTPESFESGTDEFGQTYEEQLVAQYYSTEGIFEYDVKVAKAPESGWVARSAAKGTTVRMWLVVRDNRGGVSWEERQVKVE